MVHLNLTTALSTWRSANKSGARYPIRSGLSGSKGDAGIIVPSLKGPYVGSTISDGGQEVAAKLEQAVHCLLYTSEAADDVIDV